MISRPRIDFASEKGMTLVELLVTIPIALSVAGSILSLTTIFSHSEQRVASRSAAVEAAQVGFDRITRDVRQASAIATTIGTPSNTLELSTMVPSATGFRAPGTVTWRCDLNPQSDPSGTGKIWPCSRTSTVTVNVSGVPTTTTTNSGTLFWVSGSSVTSPSANNSQIFAVVGSTTTAGSYVTITAKVPTRSPATSTSPTFTLTDSASPAN